MSLLADNIILYIENSIDSTQKLLELNEFSKISGYKTDIQNSVSFLHTNYELSEKEIKKTIPFTIASKTINYLGINLTKEMNTYMPKTIRHWWKKLKKTQINGKISHVLGLEVLILLKGPYYPKPSVDSV